MGTELVFVGGGGGGIVGRSFPHVKGQQFPGMGTVLFDFRIRFVAQRDCGGGNKEVKREARETREMREARTGRVGGKIKKKY